MAQYGRLRNQQIRRPVVVVVVVGATQPTRGPISERTRVVGLCHRQQHVGSRSTLIDSPFAAAAAATAAPLSSGRGRARVQAPADVRPLPPTELTAVTNMSASGQVHSQCE